MIFESKDAQLILEEESLNLVWLYLGQNQLMEKKDITVMFILNM